MTQEEFAALKEGDIVRGKFSGTSYVVTGNYGHHVTAVCTVDITNPDEFDLMQKDTWTCSRCYHVNPIEDSNGYVNECANCHVPILGTSV